MANVFLGVVEKYSADMLYPFFESLHKAEFEGDVVVFTSEGDREITDCLTKYSAKEIPFTTLRFKGLRFARKLLAYLNRTLVVRWPFRDRLVAKLWQCQASRYFLYREFLLSNPVYTQVVLTDIRDVYFQSKPTECLETNCLEVFEEALSELLSTELHNKRWFCEVYGEKRLKRFESFPIICSGITIGSRSAILKYLDNMTDSLSKHSVSYGFDQAIHNYLLRSNKDPSLQVKIHPFGQGPLVHVGIASLDQLQIDSKGELVDANGKSFEIVHQYDRHPILVKNFLTRLETH